MGMGNVIVKFLYLLRGWEMLLLSFSICDGDGKCYCLVSLSVMGMVNVIV